MTRERRPCACRGSIEADPADHADVLQAVQQHQQTEQHADWRVREQLAGNLVAPEGIDVSASMPLDRPTIGENDGRYPAPVELRRVA